MAERFRTACGIRDLCKTGTRRLAGGGAFLSSAYDSRNHSSIALTSSRIPLNAAWFAPRPWPSTWHRTRLATLADSRMTLRTGRPSGASGDLLAAATRAIQAGPFPSSLWRNLVNTLCAVLMSFRASP